MIKTLLGFFQIILFQNYSVYTFVNYIFSNYKTNLYIFFKLYKDTIYITSEELIVSCITYPLLQINFISESIINCIDYNDLINEYNSINYSVLINHLGI